MAQLIAPYKNHTTIINIHKLIMSNMLVSYTKYFTDQDKSLT